MIKIWANEEDKNEEKCHRSINVSIWPKFIVIRFYQISNCFIIIIIPGVCVCRVRERETETGCNTLVYTK